MNHIVALNIKSRYRRPDVGFFQWMDEHNRHVWKQTVATDSQTLARLTNEALAFMRAWDQLDMHIEVVAVEPAPESEETTEPVECSESQSKKKRKLLPTLPD